VVKYSGIITFFILLSFLLKSCDLKFKDEGFKSTSIDSKTSKENKVFIDNYNLSDSIIIVNSDTLEVVESFVEYKFNTTYSGEINIWDDIQLILVMKEKLPSDFNFKWGFKVENKYQLTGGTGDKMIHTDLYCSPKLSSCYTEFDSINVFIVNDIFSNKEFVSDTIVLKRK